MPKRSAIDHLPADIREWLEAELVRNGFADYRALVDALNAKLAAQGVDQAVSKSALHRFGQSVEENIDYIRQTSLIARTLTKESGDDEGNMNDALTRVIQAKLFHFVMDLKQDVDPKTLALLAHSISDLARASVVGKKWMIEMRRKLQEAAHKAAEAIEETVRAGGLSEEVIQAIRSKILGITA